MPYGWKNPTHYSIIQTKSPNPNLPFYEEEGTLIASPYLDHGICLQNGTYVIQFRDIPANDDFFEGSGDDYYSYLASEVGVEEYRIIFNHNKKYKLKSSKEKAIVTVNGKTATIVIKKNSHPSKYQLPVGGIIGLILTVFILTGAIFIVFFDTNLSIQRMKRLFGMQSAGTSNIDEVPMVSAEGGGTGGGAGGDSY